MTIWKMPISLADIAKRNENTLSDVLGIRFSKIGDDSLTATMTVTAKVKQPLGIMHGGASCVLAETVGSVAANYCVDQAHYYCVGLSINTSHLKAIRQGELTAIAKPYHLGHSTQVWGIEICHQKKMISINRLTMAVLARKKSKSN